MAEERTEEEQIEALKAWWDENEIKTIAAIVLVVGQSVNTLLLVNMQKLKLEELEL